MPESCPFLRLSEKTYADITLWTVLYVPHTELETNLMDEIFFNLSGAQVEDFGSLLYVLALVFLLFRLAASLCKRRDKGVKVDTLVLIA